jgi:sulfur carrier protein
MTPKTTANFIINIRINGIRHEIEKGSTISQALVVLNTNTINFVIALNQTFIPRSQYSNTLLHNNDAIELLSPMAGG